MSFEPAEPSPAPIPDMPNADTPLPASSAQVWPSSLPFGQDWNPLVQLLAEVAAGALVFVLTIATALFTARVVRRIRNAWAARHAQEDLPRDLVERVSAQYGIARARTELLRGIRREWRSTSARIKRVLDEDLAQKAEDHLLSEWTVQRQREFCVMYRRPLSVLMNTRELDLTFYRAGLVIGDGKREVFPRLVGVGETEHGMYAMFRADPSLTLEVWNDHETREVLSFALDAPELDIQEVEGQLVVLQLNDMHLRVSVEETEETEDDQE